MSLKSLSRLPFRAMRYAVNTWRNARPAAKRHGVSVWHIVREQVALKRLNGLGADEYFYYGLDDPDTPWEEKLTCLGGARTRSLWTVFTPERYQHVFKNKLVFKHLFNSMSFPVAKLYAVYDPHWGHTTEGAPFRNADDIAAWMANADVQDPVFKPVESAEGCMVLVMKGRKPSDPTKFVGVSGEEYSPERIVRYLNDPERLREAYPESEYNVPLRTFLVEQRLRQHPALTELASETLCCARFVTVTTLDGQVELLETAIKLQQDPSGVDNVIRGSVAVQVDPETGVLGTGLCATDGFHDRRRCFPGTDKEFTGFQLPMWKGAVELAESAAAAFPEAHSVGWDIAFTEEGPCIVEGNTAWGNFQIECQKGLWQGAYRETAEKLLAQRGKK